MIPINYAHKSLYSMTATATATATRTTTRATIKHSSQVVSEMALTSCRQIANKYMNTYILGQPHFYSIISRTTTMRMRNSEFLILEKFEISEFKENP